MTDLHCRSNLTIIRHPETVTYTRKLKMIQVTNAITSLRILFGIQTFSIPLYIIGYWSARGGDWSAIDMVPVVLLGMNLLAFILCWSRQRIIWFTLSLFIGMKLTIPFVYWFHFYQSYENIPTSFYVDLSFALLYFPALLSLLIQLFKSLIKG